MRRRFTALFAVLALVVGLLAGATASAATQNDTACRAQAAKAQPASGVNSAEVLEYNACRFDKVDAAVKALSTSSPTPSPSATSSSTPSTSASPTPSASATPSATLTATPSVSKCDDTNDLVKFSGQGSSGLGQYGQGNYDASAELWGVNGYNYAQTMWVCSHDRWTVDVKTDNTKGDGAVKAYPSMRRIYHDWSTTDFSRDPLVSSFPRLEVDFGAVEPASCSGCIYDTAFDVWLNGIGNGAANELMIWTYNVGQRPYGNKIASGIQLAGHTWDLWTGNQNHYIAFVPTDGQIPSGTLDVKDFVTYLTNLPQPVLPKENRLGQISYGVETVSTNAVTKRWDFTRFTIRDA